MDGGGAMGISLLSAIRLTFPLQGKFVPAGASAVRMVVQLQKICQKANFCYRKLCTGFLVDVLNGCCAGILLLNPIPFSLQERSENDLPLYQCTPSSALVRRRQIAARGRERLGKLPPSA